MFNQFASDIFDISGGNFLCDNSTGGGFCTATLQYCGYFYNHANPNFTDYNFRIGLSREDYLTIPLSSLLRNEVGNCALAVYNIDPDEPMGKQFVIGIPLFQNYFTRFQYGARDGTKNTV